jgi:hypothetical protein
MTEHRINDIGWTDENHLRINARGANLVVIHKGKGVFS